VPLPFKEMVLLLYNRERGERETEGVKKRL